LLSHGCIDPVDTGCVLCDVSCVKTISLTETAYQRLLAWKDGRTFSEVIENLVPRKGTLEAAIKASQSLPKLPDKDFPELETAINATRGKLSSSWS
jgi:predicted CopG family antitoxin